VPSRAELKRCFVLRSIAAALMPGRAAAPGPGRAGPPFGVADTSAREPLHSAARTVVPGDRCARASGSTTTSRMGSANAHGRASTRPSFVEDSWVSADDGAPVVAAHPSHVSEAVMRWTFGSRQKMHCLIIGDHAATRVGSPRLSIAVVRGSSRQPFLSWPRSAPAGYFWVCTLA
jgi:hypothetical protein